MKKLALLLGSVSLLSINAASADVNCTPSPRCALLGYTSEAGSCSGDYLVCPFDTSKIICLSQDCSDFKLSECPTGANCDSCKQTGTTLYKITSCKDGYKATTTGGCTSKTCTDYGYYALSDYVCNTPHYNVKLGASSQTCYSDCKPCPVSRPCPPNNTKDICYKTTTSSVSGYSYGTCTTRTQVTCNGTYPPCPKMAPDTPQLAVQ